MDLSPDSECSPRWAPHTADLWGVALRLVPELPVCVSLKYSVNALQTEKWENLSLSTCGIFSSWLCILAEAPLSISPHSAFAAVRSTLQKASRHPSQGDLAVQSGRGGFGTGQAQAEAGIPVAAAARAVCPACPVLLGISRSQRHRDTPVRVFSFPVPLPGAQAKAGRYKAGP